MQSVCQQCAAAAWGTPRSEAAPVSKLSSGSNTIQLLTDLLQAQITACVPCFASGCTAADIKHMLPLLILPCCCLQFRSGWPQLN